ncbi:15-hydroxyprostaglandin dehydrogenase [NAD(+)]-like [Stegostoma tigrinum]|uniref:15-hydroxyprostaglandin dehydrogenase [NAD(+)]-like n=1 Tax=Stegostoma tigrinum TaxID=3053191 RepID=UPI00202B75B7|nr:15-hydroxyprostaglandin dehydrogenase [NAD(+)]-like [Stegostoma tigrinum]XP_048399868.1 15-hydroxyprostaglandin dehydrogenase [NAD(+)]-like [Stegostoma tigrinum]XP_048399869.1 15-hydroxyprostaglandin dehydrogenase [NAD(+)]-like [Stegostoma tigrinum]XP_059506573.1 15-hydroxyprostaglandin dehydrogenase [NAD(+)]-like [Stegostoma tigrinum]
MSLSGKVALITGAAQGLGKAFAEILLKNGAKVSLLDINSAIGLNTKSMFDKVYGAQQTMFIACDVTSGNQLEGAFKKTTENFLQLDIVCNNAGVGNETNWQRCLDINLVSVIRGTYLGLDYMNKKTGSAGGVIVNVSSMAGLYPVIFGPVYSASKHGVVGFSRAVAGASAAENLGVRINVLCPAFTDTPIMKSISSPETLGQFIGLDQLAVQAVAALGIIDPLLVAEGFLQLVTDKTKNGDVMKVSKQGGIDYQKYSKSLW